MKGKVLILEAGGYGSPFVFNIPIIQPLLLRSDYDHKHETISQKFSCKGLNDEKSFWPTGKIIAGTSRLNNMIYRRSPSVDYEGILNEVEAEKYFKKVEDEVVVTETYFKSNFSKALIKGFYELGFDSKYNYNFYIWIIQLINSTDFGFTNLTHKHGRRISQFNNYWTKIKNPLEVCSNAMVTKIIFDEENPKKAIGVEFIKNGEIHKVRSKKIVLAAGTLGSPKILMHSGIGLRDHLTQLGIDVIENLPVGENLQDHVTTPIDIILNQTDITVSRIFDPKEIFKYLFDGKDSPFSLGGSDSMGFVKLNENIKLPDLSFISIPTSITFDYGIHLRKIVNLRDDVWDKYYKPLIGKTSATILPVLLHPKSVGSIRLKSKHFKDSLIIDPNYLESREDIDKLISGIRIIQKLLETSPMKQLGAELIPKSLPDCKSRSYDSNDYWKCYIQHLTLTMYHYHGTCRLGDLNDKKTVVMKNFQVKNIENLYVVDASILPRSPSTNPHALISMLAQKFAHDMNLLDN